jgi:Putative threonine/serine exporter
LATLQDVPYCTVLYVKKLARALMTFGAPSHRIESQLVAVARILEVDAEFIHLPNIFLLSFADPETCTSETHFIKCSGRLAQNLNEVHQIYRQVVHDEMSAKRATDHLDFLGYLPRLDPLCDCLLPVGIWRVIRCHAHCRIWCACAQLAAVVKSQLYANVFEYGRSYHFPSLISPLSKGLASPSSSHSWPAR